jgi:hypothetical protein
MRNELRKRLATEYRYAATKMQEAPPERKMFYFSVLFGEAPRILNFEWDDDLSLLHMVAQTTYNQVNAQLPALGSSLPIKAITIYEMLTQTVSDIAAYFEKEESESKREELYQCIVRLSVIAYTATGNGNYLLEKGVIQL